MGNSVSAEVQLLQEKFKAAIEEGNAEEIKNLLSAGAMPSYVYHTDMDDLETSSTYSPMIAAVVANQDQLNYFSFAIRQYITTKILELIFLPRS